jgi:hypothetical protein
MELEKVTGPFLHWYLNFGGRELAKTARKAAKRGKKAAKKSTKRKATKRK